MEGENESDDSDEFHDAIDECKSDDDEDAEEAEQAEETDAETRRQQEAIRQMVLSWKPIDDLGDDFRHPEAHKDGGFPLNDAEVIGKYRNAFTWYNMELSVPGARSSLVVAEYKP